MIHAALEELNIVRVKFKAQNIFGKVRNLSANIDDAADHADTGTLARHGRKIFAVDAANNRTSAAHEFKRKTSDVFQNPKFRLFVKRIMFHERTRSSARTPADINFAAA